MSSSHPESHQDHETVLGGPPFQKKKIIHFSNGDTLEMDNSEDEEDEGPPEETRLTFNKVLTAVGRISLMVCDFLGERLAGAVGLNAAKYQYAIDQYNCEHKTSGERLQRLAETIHLSPGLDGGHYGATEDICSISEAQEKHEKPKGHHNRGYQTDEDGWKSN